MGNSDVLELFDAESFKYVLKIWHNLIVVIEVAS